MAKVNYFYITIMCALSASGLQAGGWYEVTKLLPWKVEHGGPGSSGRWGGYDPISVTELMAEVGGGISKGYEKIKEMIEQITPEYVRGIQKGTLPLNRYNPNFVDGGVQMSDFEVLGRALRGTYGSELQKIAQEKENQLALALAGEGLAQAAEAQIKSSWSNLGNFARHHLGERLGSFWSNIARPGIEGIGSASRYLVPTNISEYAQTTFPAVQRFTSSYPRETQNLALGIATPIAALAAYKLLPQAYRGAQNVYRQWNAPTLEQLENDLASKEATHAQILKDIIDSPNLSEETKSNSMNLAEEVYSNDPKLKALKNKIRELKSAQQQSWFSGWSRPSLSLPSSISWPSSWSPSSWWYGSSK